MSIIQAGAEISKSGNCHQCGHPVGWHPKVEAVNPMGCLECSCNLNFEQAKERQATMRANSNKAGG